ncbi:hypothetical protein NHX12_029880, partial [Muraenolepis orangiensis]
MFLVENNTIDSGEVDVGRRAIQDVPPGIFWRSQIYIDQPQFLKFNISVQREALVGVYGRKGLPPSHTQYDFVELLDGSRLLSKEKRSLSDADDGVVVAISARRGEDDGVGVAISARRGEDDGVAISARRGEDDGVGVAISARRGEDDGVGVAISTRRGEDDGVGVARRSSRSDEGGGVSVGVARRSTRSVSVHEAGFIQFMDTGVWHLAFYNDGRNHEQVSYSTVVIASCPLLCSGNGQYSRGRCQCHSGWKGPECAVPSSRCVDAHCGGHGVCIVGACICNTGHKGANCEEVDCMDPSCSAHGVCVHGECRCQPGRGGASCELPKAMCPDQCSGHGTHDAETGSCACDPSWTGSDCSQEVCTVNCGSRGVCYGGTACRCEDGWTGAVCELKACHPTCAKNGVCKDGKCECDQGWTGEHCNI